MATCLSDAPLVAISGFLNVQVVGRLRATSRSMGADLALHMETSALQAWESIAGPLTNAHYQELFGSSQIVKLLCQRRCLYNVNAATQFSQWRTETAVARLMQGVDLDAGDLFSCLRRACLASQLCGLEKTLPVVHWMHVLGAVEEQDPVQAKLLAGEAWRAMAPLVTKQTVLWPVQTAHFVDDLCSLGHWLLRAKDGSGGPDAPELLSWLGALACQLETTPALGRYGPAGDTSQVRARHLTKLMQSLQESILR
mmetsp:Transcript_82957/g.216169  ORF Transcript_82957/g.216169 Transcript_82957/m.216169 type:complete len:254 (-) Transcript_82957:46-807(-)